MPFPNFIGNKRYWTQERVNDSLQKLMLENKGPLPCSDTVYNPLKKGRLDLPTIKHIYDYYGSLARAWIAVGAPKRRISMFNVEWITQEDVYLLEYGGIKMLKDIARDLNRSYGSVKARLGKHFQLPSRHVQGFYSAAELSKEFKCPCHRVRALLHAGVIKGRYDKRRNRWEIDICSLSKEALEALRKPKGTHKTWATDMGDYYMRHGLKRTVIDGRTICVPA